MFKKYIILFAFLIANIGFSKPIELKATLAGHLIIPKSEVIPSPKDAPSDLKTSGKYIKPFSLNRNQLIEGTSNGRPTGSFIPIAGQPLQGFSGIKMMPDQSFWIITDNGAGNQKNSADFLLYLNHFRFNFQQNKTKRLETIFLKDPNHRVPFRILHEDSKQRYLTGSDFDIESFQWVDDVLWIGDEFGPFLIKANRKGEIMDIFPLSVDNILIQSPDNPLLKTPSSPAEPTYFNISRSKGFEGLALSKDKSKLYALLEGPIYHSKNKQFEAINHHHFLRILEFDLKTEKWTGNYWKYVLDDNQHAIGDFNMIDESTALVIERDNQEGVPEYACKAQQNSQHCFSQPAKFKRIYKIVFDSNNVFQPVKKIAYIDLMKINDPHQISRKPLSQGYFVFPFFTIENVDVVDSNHIIVGNDNNYPFSSSRHPNKQDDNELIILDVGNFLKPEHQYTVKKTKKNK